MTGDPTPAAPTRDAPTRAAPTPAGPPPATFAPVVDRTVEALVFDWDGTAVPDRRADAHDVRRRVEALTSAGVHVVIVTGTHLSNVDDQLGARPGGRGRLAICCNRGSEVFTVTGDGPHLLHRRQATPGEDAALDRAAARTVELLGERGVAAAVVAERLNRRKIDLIPLPEWADPAKADIARLTDAVAERLAAAGVAGLTEVVALADGAAQEAGLADPRITSDVKHVEIGLTDKSDSAVWAAGWLAAEGVTGGLVLVGGDEFGPLGGVEGSDSFMLVPDLARATVVSVGVEPGGVPDGVVHVGGGPARFGAILDDQLARRTERRVPAVDHDPAWVVPLSGRRDDERVGGSIGALGNGLTGTRGSLEGGGPGSDPLFLVGGVYDADGTLLPGPVWTTVDRPGRTDATPHPAVHRVLDLRTGVLLRAGDGPGFRSLRFASLADPHTLALRVEGTEPGLTGGKPLRPPAADVAFERHDLGRLAGAHTGPAGTGITAVARDLESSSGGRRTVERLVTWSTDAGAAPGPSLDDAVSRLVDAEARSFDGLLADHRRAWADRWSDAGVTIDGDPEAELAARFAVFHLLSSADDHGEAAVGPRGLTGRAYGGHVFWDADVFVLPALCALRPAAARAMLEYRIRRLPAARQAAVDQGARGARFPWESAGDGVDVTPRKVLGQDGELVPVASGLHERHIVADVAWAADHYAAWTGDGGFLDGPGRDLMIETARYWSSTVHRGAAGDAHLYGVEGPDEYHDVVDDNAFTNVMARWNLRRGADLLAASGRPDERAEAGTWRDLAGRLVDGWDPVRGIYEQFAGYFSLEPLLMAEIARPPVLADILLGAGRVAASQLIKQADVLMLHHLVPDEVVAGSLGPCLDFYGPRTAHGSSLSPAVHASLLARAGRPDEALELFHLAAGLDLDDLTGTTAGGLHLATMGGVWQALAFGFLGLAAVDGTLDVRPCLPTAWDALGLTFRFAGRRVTVRADHGQVTVTSDAPLPVHVAGAPPARFDPGTTTVDYAGPTTDRSTP